MPTAARKRPYFALRHDAVVSHLPDSPAAVAARRLRRRAGRPADRKPRLVQRADRPLHRDGALGRDDSDAGRAGVQRAGASTSEDPARARQSRHDRADVGQRVRDRHRAAHRDGRRRHRGAAHVRRRSRPGAREPARGRIFAGADRRDLPDTHARRPRRRPDGRRPRGVPERGRARRCARGRPLPEPREAGGSRRPRSRTSRARSRRSTRTCEAAASSRSTARPISSPA